jgi:DNA replication protein DnaC
LLIAFGPPGGGKSHRSAALGLALIENGRRVFFARTTDLVQRLQIARREFGLESAIATLDRYDLLILDDLTVRAAHGSSMTSPRIRPRSACCLS